MATETTTRVVTGKVRFSYVHIFTPHSVEKEGEKKYSISIIISKSDTETIKKVEAAIEAAKVNGKDKLSGKGKLKLPLRDGDEEKDDDDAYRNSFFISASSRTMPGIVDKNRVEILDADDVYSGCYGRASINFYAFNTNGNKGIACGLNNVQKLKDGDPLGGSRSRAEDDFAEAIEEDDDDLFG